MKENFICSFFSRYNKKGYSEGKDVFLAMDVEQQKQIEQYLLGNEWWNFATVISMLFIGIFIVKWIF